MALEIIAISVIGVGVIVTGAGMVRLWVKNGREAAKRDGALGATLKNISSSQVEIKDDISLIRGDVNKQAVHCARVVGGFTERFESLEKDK